MVDIENASSLSSYLTSNNLITKKEILRFEVLTGGVSNKTILWKRENYPNWVIKQGLNKLRVKLPWYSDPKRLGIEYSAITWLSEILEEGSVPRPFYWDPIHFILGMEAIPLPHRNLKDILLEGDFKQNLIQDMGSLLAKIHIVGYSSPTAKKIFYNQAYFKSLRIEPYYITSSKALPLIKHFFDQLIEETLQIQETVVHGDYSPKNILVRNNRLILLDHEVMHFGDPAFDLGFSLCHFLSKANHLVSVRSKLIHAAVVYWQSYLNTNPAFDSVKNNERVVRHTLGCLISRVVGSSPLEYLTNKEKKRQLDSSLKLIRQEIQNVPELISSYSHELDNEVI